MINLNDLTRRFLLNEGTKRPSISSYVQSILENLSIIKPRSAKERNSISMAGHQLKEIKKLTRKLEERVNLLEEQIKILEEGKTINENQKTSQ